MGLEEVKDSLKKLAEGKGKCVEYPVHQVARNGYVKLMEFILRTSFDLNTKDDIGWTALHLACRNGQTETAQLIIQNSKEFGIDIKAQNNQCKTALDRIKNRDGEKYNQIKKMLEKEYSQIDVTESVQKR